MRLICGNCESPDFNVAGEAVERAGETDARMGDDDWDRAVEMLSLVEPHKLNQRSVTMVRKISGFKERYLETRREEIRQNIARFFRVTR